MVGLESQAPAMSIDGAVGIFRDGKDIKNAGFMLVGDKVIERLIGFVDDVVFFSKLLVERRLQMAELGGTPPPLLCHGTETGSSIKYDAMIVGGIDKDLEARVTPIFEKIIQSLKRTKITVTVDVAIDRQKLQDSVDFYMREWKIVETH
jgi:hypothetical protein